MVRVTIVVHREIFIASRSFALAEYFEGQNESMTDKKNKKSANADFACPRGFSGGELRVLTHH
jgi:hypothetical protein